MNLTFRFKVSLMRRFGRVERANEAMRAVHSNGGAKFILVVDDAKNTGFAIRTGRSAIFQIGGSRDIAKVAEDVIAAIRIAVINVVGRPFACHVKPSEPMFKVNPSVDSDLPVSLCIHTAGAVSNAAFACFGTSSEYAGLWVVVHKAAQALQGKWSHPFILIQPFRARALI